LVAVVESASGREYSLFADKTDLEYPEPPGKGRSVEGWIKVEVLQCERGLCLVRLPQSTLENGSCVTVKEDRLDRVAGGRCAGVSR
jgi:hypothetical protein